MQPLYFWLFHSSHFLVGGGVWNSEEYERKENVNTTEVCRTFCSARREKVCEAIRLFRLFPQAVLPIFFELFEW